MRDWSSMKILVCISQMLVRTRYWRCGFESRQPRKFFAILKIIFQERTITISNNRLVQYTAKKLFYLILSIFRSLKIKTAREKRLAICRAGKLISPQTFAASTRYLNFMNVIKRGLFIPEKLDWNIFKSFTKVHEIFFYRITIVFLFFFFV